MIHGVSGTAIRKYAYKSVIRQSFDIEFTSKSTIMIIILNNLSKTKRDLCSREGNFVEKNYKNCDSYNYEEKQFILLFKVIFAREIFHPIILKFCSYRNYNTYVSSMIYCENLSSL